MRAELKLYTEKTGNLTMELTDLQLEAVLLILGIQVPEGGDIREARCFADEQLEAIVQYFKENVTVEYE